MVSKTKISLGQALNRKIISAKSVCAGGLEINYHITNLIKDSLVIIVPAGWRFNSDAGNNDYQDILTTHPEVFVLGSKQTKTFDVKGFCCEYTKGGPIKGAKYTLGKLADSNLVSLARFLSIHSIDLNTQQYSVWAISDNKETANITCSNDSVAQVLRTFVAHVKGEPQPWYTLLKKSNISQLGSVNDLPIRFKAKIEYAVNKACYASCYIIDEKGNQVSEIFSQWFYPENTTYQANFNVVGLQKGNYKLVLQNKTDSLFEKSFKI
jgi:hypothetical protein